MRPSDNATSKTRRHVAENYAAGDKLNIIDLTEYAKNNGIPTAILSQHIRHLERDKILIPTKHGIIRQGGTSRIFKVSDDALKIADRIRDRENHQYNVERDSQINTSLKALLNWLDDITRARLNAQ